VAEPIINAFDDTRLVFGGIFFISEQVGESGGFDEGAENWMTYSQRLGVYETKMLDDEVVEFDWQYDNTFDGGAFDVLEEEGAIFCYHC
jgi:hypothetical protein